MLRTVAASPGVLVYADRHESVALAGLVGALTMVLLDQRQPAVEAALAHQCAHAGVLDAHESVACHVGAVAVLARGEHDHRAPAGIQSNQPVARPQPQLAADAVEAVVLRLAEVSRAVGSDAFGAAVGAAEHETEERHRQTVVEDRIAIGVRNVPIVLPPFEPVPLDQVIRCSRRPKGLR